MRSVDDMSEMQLESERRYVKSRINSNPLAVDYLKSIDKEIKKRKKGDFNLGF